MEEQGFLPIAEDFLSIQGEGITTGVPSYFIRLMNCNLTCGASVSLVNMLKKGKIEVDPGEFQGDLHQEGKATWTCDTIPVWIKGHKKPYSYLIDRFKEQGIYDWVKEGRVHLIWTGGEPTIPQSQKAIVEFIKYYDKEVGFNFVYHEIETNGTIYIEQDLFKQLNQINCSVKLANSGMDEKKRIIPAALNRIMEHPEYYFKFVISTEEDLKEIERDFVKPFNIPFNRVLMMPGLDDQQNFHERTKFVLEMAKKYGYIGLTRLHVSGWNKTTGC